MKSSLAKFIGQVLAPKHADLQRRLLADVTSHGTNDALALDLPVPPSTLQSKPPLPLSGATPPQGAALTEPAQFSPVQVSLPLQMHLPASLTGAAASDPLAPALKSRHAEPTPVTDGSVHVGASHQAQEANLRDFPPSDSLSPHEAGPLRMPLGSGALTKHEWERFGFAPNGPTGSTGADGPPDFGGFIWTFPTQMNVQRHLAAPPGTSGPVKVTVVQLDKAGELLQKLKAQDQGIENLAAWIGHMQKSGNSMSEICSVMRDAIPGFETMSAVLDRPLC